MQIPKDKVEIGCDLDETKVVFTLNLESRKLMVAGFVTTQYKAEEDEDKIERPHVILRDAEFEAALDEILPDSDEVTWTNPRETLFTNLANLIIERM